ncbi:MAG: DUF4239 domain-containing protein [Gammaproteobacteria bacterium]|nr:DUF4239 domain-containing protein [Gammaproteobacteria bacterium]
MRLLILSLPIRLQPIFIIGITIALAFLVAFICSLFFDSHQLAANTDLTSSVYQVLGTIYAIMLTFTLWGVWQNFTDAGKSVQDEAFALLDLVHTLESSPSLDHADIRGAVLNYLKLVVEQEWPTLQSFTSNLVQSHEKSRSVSYQVVTVIQDITPHEPRDVAIFGQTITMLNKWLDSRRARILTAKGNSVKALWPLLMGGALVLFGFHGLFIAKTIGIWVALLFGLSLVIGLTFYLIFSLDCPFAGTLSIDSEPFELAINILKNKDEGI